MTHMTHTSTEQEHTQEIEKSLRLAREAYAHEVEIAREDLKLPEAQRKPQEQLHRLGDMICLLQNILYAAQQAARSAQVVPQDEPVAYLWQHIETGRTRVVMPDMVITADASWVVVGPLYLSAAPQPPASAVNESLAVDRQHARIEALEAALVEAEAGLEMATCRLSARGSAYPVYATCEAKALEIVRQALGKSQTDHFRGVTEMMLPTTQGLDANAYERAAKKMAEIAEYDWDQLPDKQREEFRADALAVLTAALGQGHE